MYLRSDDDERFVIYYFFSIGSEAKNLFKEEYNIELDTNKFYYEYYENENEKMTEITEEEVNNIKLSGNITTRFGEEIGGNEYYYGYYDISSQMASWFSGEVEYAD